MNTLMVALLVTVGWATPEGLDSEDLANYELIFSFFDQDPTVPIQYPYDSIPLYVSNNPVCLKVRAIHVNPDVEPGDWSEPMCHFIRAE